MLCPLTFHASHPVRWVSAGAYPGVRRSAGLVAHFDNAYRRDLYVTELRFNRRHRAVNRPNAASNFVPSRQAVEQV